MSRAGQDTHKKRGVSGVALDIEVQVRGVRAPVRPHPAARGLRFSARGAVWHLDIMVSRGDAFAKEASAW